MVGFTFGTFVGPGDNIYPTRLLVGAAKNSYVSGYTAGALPLVNAYEGSNCGGFSEGLFAMISTAP